MRNSLIAVALAAGLQASMGSAVAGHSRIDPFSSISVRLSPPATRTASKTHSADVGVFGYSRGLGWSVAHVKRIAAKRRNVARNKAAHRLGKYENR